MAISAIAYLSLPNDPTRLRTNRQVYALAGIAEVCAWIGFVPTLLKSIIPVFAENMLLNSRVQHLFPSPTTEKVACLGAVLFLLILVWHKNNTDSGGGGPDLGGNGNVKRDQAKGLTTPHSFSSGQTRRAPNTSKPVKKTKINEAEKAKIAAHLDTHNLKSDGNGVNVSSSINFDDDE